MSRRAKRAVLIVGALGAIAAALLTAVIGDRGGADGPSVSNDLVPGTVFSIRYGAPVDVSLYRSVGTTRCMHVSGAFHATTSCFDVDGAAAAGSYQVLVPPFGATTSVLVIGVMPSGASRATVEVGRTTARVTTRGRWFLARLAPGELGEENRAPVSVEFS
jgi:hypothetical protein